jgi:hypothetical protein
VLAVSASELCPAEVCGRHKLSLSGEPSFVTHLHGPQFFPSTRYLDYAVAVETYTLQKAPNLVRAKQKQTVGDT